jgi:hypothetical protein
MEIAVTFPSESYPFAVSVIVFPRYGLVSSENDQGVYFHIDLLRSIVMS